MTTKHTLRIFKYFLLVSLPLIFIMGSITALIYFFEARAERRTIEISESSRVEAEARHIMEEFGEAVTDLMVLSTHQEVRDFLDRGDLEGLVQEVLEFSEIKVLYDQLRFLDETGMETIRVNYKDGKSYLVAQGDLQHKGHRYYFKETTKLNEGEIYISPFDLNIENGEIELPLKPMIRFAVPVFDTDGNKRGVAVANYLGEHLLKALEHGSSSSYGHTMLLNSDGFWLRGMNEADEWGFMYEDKQDKVFGADYPEEWKKIFLEESGQIYTEKGLFVFTTIHPLREVMPEVDYSWKIVNHVTPDELSTKPRRLLLQIAVIDGLLVVIIVGGGWLLAKNMAKRKEAESKVVELNGLLKLLNKILRHDLLNDLTVVQGNIGVYFKYGKKAGLDQTLEDMSKSMKRGIDFIHKMKDLESAITSGKALKPVDVGKIISEVQTAFPELKFSVSGDGIVLADEALTSVITNIVRNAQVHGKSEKIDVGIAATGNVVELRIADSGKGIPDKIKKELFQEGFKHGETGHTGLGLFIVKKTIERYGGKVWIEDNKPNGAIFVIHLPKAENLT